MRFWIDSTDKSRGRYHQEIFVTNADRAIEETARVFRIGDKTPKVSQMIYGNPDNR